MANRDDRPDMTRLIEALLCSPRTGQAVARTLMVQHRSLQDSGGPGGPPREEAGRGEAMTAGGPARAGSPWIRTH
jgi:hypothetical protein